MLIGGDGNDTLLGGAGDDVLLGGPGTTPRRRPGDNVVIDSLGANPRDLGEGRGQRWLRRTRTVQGKTVLKFKGEWRTIPRADLV